MAICHALMPASCQTVPCLHVVSTMLPADLTAGFDMSPEILGWHEQHDVDNVQTMDGTPVLSRPTQAPEHTAASQLGHLPASAFKSAQSSAIGLVGKPARVEMPSVRYFRTYLW